MPVTRVPEHATAMTRASGRDGSGNRLFPPAGEEPPATAPVMRAILLVRHFL
jgi:hypothetical protein